MQVVNDDVRLITFEDLHLSGARSVPAWWFGFKRAFDVIVAGVVLLFTLPIIVAAALAIAIVDRGAPFYSQVRVGMHGRRFRMFKLRTMVEGAHDMRDDLLHLNEVDGPVFKIKNDPRLHPLGAFLRRTSIDELPNLFNVLRGEMSLVGPRPPLPCEVEHYGPYEMRRLSVMPGVTCLWQISGRCGVSFDEWMRLDNAYIDTWSPLSDMAILLRTVPAVIRKDGAH
ncbi:MAG TPA: sugar transferase [Candidatus Baltobacteraceae bacterium]|nr:sugar transferase [Candidatus Baltobacteraceae bacterium]